MGILDVSDERALKDFIDGYARAAWPPIRGVMHAAGILEHALIPDLDPEQLTRSSRPKMAAWLLDRVFDDKPLDFFIMFSSAAALLRSPRLGAYAAANSFLDALAQRRRGRGKSALSINWGIWSETGMASRFAAGSVRSLATHGMGSMTTQAGLQALERLIASPAARAAVLPVDWKKWAELYPGNSAPPFLSGVLTGRFEQSQPFGAPGSRVPAAVEDLPGYLVATLGAVLRYDPSEVDPDLPINTFGVDSLTALEFKNRIGSDLHVNLPMVRFLQGPTLTELSAEIALLWEGRRNAIPALGDSHTEALAHLDNLTDSEVDAALVSLLGEGRKP
jgi:hypothetical protein